MKTLEGEWHVVIKACKFTVFEILGDFCVIIYCMSTLSLHIESTNSMIYIYKHQLRLAYTARLVQLVPHAKALSNDILVIGFPIFANSFKNNC